MAFNETEQIATIQDETALFIKANLPAVLTGRVASYKMQWTPDGKLEKLLSVIKTKVTEAQLALLELDKTPEPDRDDIWSNEKNDLEKAILDQSNKYVMTINQGFGREAGNPNPRKGSALWKINKALEMLQSDYKWIGTDFLSKSVDVVVDEHDMTKREYYITVSRTNQKPNKRERRAELDVLVESQLRAALKSEEVSK